MNIMYLTNPDVKDINLIPGILKKAGDTVFTQTTRFSPDLIKNKNIEFIVSDRTRFLIGKDILDLLPQKIINLHPSYLPWARGYHPNYWSIVKKYPFGVSIHYIDQGIDTGNIIAQSRIFYELDETLRNTYDRARNFLVNLFEVSWPYLKKCSIKGMKQEINSGSIHYKKEFENEVSKLKNGWDTKIKDLINE